MYTPPAPLTPEDVLDAVRTVLQTQEKSSYVPWRTTLWYSEDRLVQDIREARRNFASGRFWHPWNYPFGYPLVMEVLVYVGMPNAQSPEVLMHHLRSLGLTSESCEKDLLAGLALLDHTEVLHLAVLRTVPMQILGVAMEVYGVDGLRLLLEAGLGGDEIRGHVTSLLPLDVEMLRTLSALR